MRSFWTECALNPMTAPLQDRSTHGDTQKGLGRWWQSPVAISPEESAGRTPPKPPEGAARKHLDFRLWPLT